jgi:hypothetical protein
LPGVVPRISVNPHPLGAHHRDGRNIGGSRSDYWNNLLCDPDAKNLSAVELLRAVKAVPVASDGERPLPARRNVAGSAEGK